jgi:hypothetical protein
MELSRENFTSCKNSVLVDYGGSFLGWGTKIYDLESGGGRLPGGKLSYFLILEAEKEGD